MEWGVWKMFLLDVSKELPTLKLWKTTTNLDVKRFGRQNQVKYFVLKLKRNGYLFISHNNF